MCICCCVSCLVFDISFSNFNMLLSKGNKVSGCRPPMAPRASHIMFKRSPEKENRS